MAIPRVVAVGGAVALVLLCPAANAQEDARGQTVTERPRPEVDPLGIRVGGFLLSPQVSVTETYNDNIFAQDTGTTDDYITVATPAIALNSQFGSHSLNFRADASVGRYLDSSNEDFVDYTSGIDGRVDITRDSNISAGLTYSHLHEDRGSPDDVLGLEPGEYDLYGGTIGGYQRLGRFLFNLDGVFSRYDYSDVVTSSGVIVNNDDRDRIEADASLRVGYEIIPAYEAFVIATVNARDYEDGADDGGADRDSDGYDISAGTVIDLSGIAYADLFAGYREQSFEDPQLGDERGLSFGGTLTWNVTKLTTIKGFVTRSIGETTIAGASDSFNTSFRASVDHELLRNLLLAGEASVSRSDFNGVNRQDDTITAAVGAQYLVNRFLYLSVDYSYTDKNSSIAGSDFVQNVVLLRLQTQL